MEGLNRQIRAIFTDEAQSLWHIWLTPCNFPYKIKVYDLVWQEPNGFPSGYWTVGTLQDRMDDKDIQESPDEFKSVLNSLIEHTNE